MSKVLFNEFEDDRMPLFKCLAKTVDLYEIIRYLKTLNMNLHSIESNTFFENIDTCLKRSCALQQV